MVWLTSCVTQNKSPNLSGPGLPSLLNGDSTLLSHCESWLSWHLQGCFVNRKTFYMYLLIWKIGIRDIRDRVGMGGCFHIGLWGFFTQVFFFFFLNWSIVDLQCCASLCCIAEWLSYTHLYILFYILFHYGLSREIGCSSLCYSVGPCCLSILNVIVCIPKGF